MSKILNKFKEYIKENEQKVLFMFLDECSKVKNYSMMCSAPDYKIIETKLIDDNFVFDVKKESNTYFAPIYIFDKLIEFFEKEDPENQTEKISLSIEQQKGKGFCQCFNKEGNSVTLRYRADIKEWDYIRIII